MAGNPSLHDYHMIREIREQPEAFKRIVEETRPQIRKIVREAWQRNRPETHYIIGCGSSYYAAMIGAFYLEYSLGLAAVALPSSEFLWFAPRSGVPSPILIALSRSGRTSETLEATRKAIKSKIPTVAVTSDPRSTMGDESDHCLDTRIPNEQSTIMTKTFTGSALCTMLLGVELARLRGLAVSNNFESELGQLCKCAEEVVRTVEDQAKKIADKSDKMIRFIYLGAGADFPACLEGALKLRETSYSASEAYHSMEFRHGPFAELDRGIQVFAVVQKDRSVRQETTLLKEITSTGASVVPISNVPEIVDTYPDSIRMPDRILVEFAPLLSMIPMQMFAYYYALKRGLNPDQPRNLTRYVTTTMAP